MKRVSKISIALEEEHLRRARAAAVAEGLSLSAFIARALGNHLERQDRLDAATELWTGWGPETVPTPEERATFRATMTSRARTGAGSKRRRKAA